MKRVILSFLTLICALQVFAQTSNVVLYTENGERFYAILNGMRMNDEAVTNLKVEDLNQPNYALKVIFENKELGEMNKNLYLETGSEIVYAIKLNNKGSYKLSVRSSVPIAQAAPPAPQQQVVYWGAPAVTTTTTATAPQSTVVVEETVTTTTTTTGNGISTNMTTPEGENVSVNVTADGFGFNMNVNTNGTSTGSTSTVGNNTISTTTTTTTTTTTGGQAVVAEPVYETAAPCNQLNPTDFESAKSSIKKKSFSDSKMALAKQITQSNCLTAAQIKDLTSLFDYESDRLEYAKFAFAYCYEQNRYYMVNDAFEFESSIEELDEYIRMQR